MSELAVTGGRAIRSTPWPQWPRTTAAAEAAVTDVLRSGRWAVSGLSNGAGDAYDTRFARAFAQYNGVGFCIPTANGTSALMCAMRALGIGAGDEVIVPGLTWVACASAVVAIGATPVLVDIDPHSLCIDPAAARDALTPRTRAIMAVHLFNAVADLDSLTALANDAGIALIEDCAQAHGARWRGKRVGSIGTVGTFSMQNGKVLTAGEGGACICSDAELADRIYRARSDGRRLSAQRAPAGRMDLEEAGGVFAQNFCLSEIQAAVLCARLHDLDDENRLRAQRVERLRRSLSEIGGFGLQRSSAGSEQTTLYHFPVRLEGPAFDGIDAAPVGTALSAELGCWVHQPYAPLDRHALLEAGRASVPRPLRNADEAHRRHVVLPHWLFLGAERDIDDIASAFDKVKRNARQLEAAS
ncbi:DegT/DnrJ/EryC1/StrS family aminotransferase [Trinickia terrae]|uniref:DegT/DnrJ/EryC1/StrS family aminotransferase n=1 Tax=Trinickia terrae TaxID=2571161 RepID=A0A4U1I257_9BURK|nr:DegT/DnrJ/EryC1/StrS family aminotransferase [Trinickia terrae]TKC87281.1 DegT/DnrJ/EryC1/StrS family aminotransferase [Trinickia terrae]